MHTTAVSLIGFACWLVLLTFAVAFFRVSVTARTAKVINQMVRICQAVDTV